jgi:tetratricopeptide (TPR) repeat protein
LNVNDLARSRAAAGGGGWPPLPGIEPFARSDQADSFALLVEEFVAAWAGGERPTAEMFFDRHPRLFTQPEAAIRLIYEEVCLRQGEGQEVRLSELVRRFPRWQTELAVVLDCDRLLAAIPGPPSFPEAGETLGDFLLLAELGRGARGRCFLAAQPSLSDRQVVLKLTPYGQLEHLSLARLQHTHIMPLYSDHEFPDRRLRALCMPYLGGTTLARLLAEIAGVPPDRRSGQSLLGALDRSQQAHPWPQCAASPARRFLAQSSYAHAVCWIFTCLADALQYAHERGLVHMDVKPSNILLTADGQPMLLDFHLAREPIAIGEPPSEGVGGTPGYMSPEQSAAVKAMESGQPIPAAVDARSDIYSLGCAFAQMLGAEGQPTAGDGPWHPARFMPGVSTELAELVRKCLAADPSDRYTDAAALADDLRRHMADQPLRGVSNRSVRERWRKWCRRQPYELFRVKTLFFASCSAVAIGAVVWAVFLAPRFRGALRALEEGNGLLERRDYPAAARALTRGTALIEGLPGGGRLARELTAALRLADHLEEADRLHRLVDRLRFAESAANHADPSAREVERHCRALWESRRSLLEAPAAPLDPQLEQRLRDDLLDLAVIRSNLSARLETDPVMAAKAHRAGLALLDEAESCFGPSHVLYRARQAHAAALGLSELAESAGRAAARVQPRTAWEHDAAGRVLLANGDLRNAQAAFEQAVALRPQDLWPNFHQGACAFRLGRYQEAESAFRVCVALAPDRAECFYNRAKARAALGQTAGAKRDYDRAFSLDPSLARAPLDRRLSQQSTTSDERVAP